MNKKDESINAWCVFEHARRFSFVGEVRAVFGIARFLLCINLAHIFRSPAPVIRRVSFVSVPLSERFFLKAVDQCRYISLKKFSNGFIGVGLLRKRN